MQELYPDVDPQEWSEQYWEMQDTKGTATMERIPNKRDTNRVEVTTYSDLKVIGIVRFLFFERLNQTTSFYLTLKRVFFWDVFPNVLEQFA